jgi:hypothetical protein
MREACVQSRTAHLGESTDVTETKCPRDICFDADVSMFDAADVDSKGESECGPLV